MGNGEAERFYKLYEMGGTFCRSLLAAVEGKKHKNFSQQEIQSRDSKMDLSSDSSSEEVHFPCTIKLVIKSLQRCAITIFFINKWNILKLIHFLCIR